MTGSSCHTVPRRTTPDSFDPAGAILAVRGTVEEGDRRGRTLGFPTANIAVEDSPLLDGVWAGWLEHDDARRPAAISIGRRPTFYGADGFRLLEAHVLDFTGDLYGAVVTVWLGAKLRDQQRFPSIDELVRQLDLDLGATREYVARHASSVAGLVLPENSPLGCAVHV